MLKKYQNFKKISRSSQCCFYQADIRQNMQKVLIKRVKCNCSWNDMLKSKALKIQSTEHFFPKALQIFKSNGEYFIVYERPSGISMSFLIDQVQKQLAEFYQIFNDLLNSLIKLSQQIPNLYIYPEWLYLHRNILKICHFQPYFGSQQENQIQKKTSHVFMYDLTSRVKKNENQNKLFFDFKRIKNLNFNLGYIAYHILTGKTTSWKFIDEDYQSKIKQIQLNAQVRICKQTKNSKLAEIIGNLLKSQDDEIELANTQNQHFQEFRSYVKRKCIEHKCCKNKETFRIVQFSLQKMNLNRKISKIKVQKKKKCIRPCCCKKFQDQSNPQDQESVANKFKVIQIKQRKNQKVESKINKIVAENSSSQSQKRLISKSPFQNRSILNRHKINSSCCLPNLKTERKNSLGEINLKLHHHRASMLRTSKQKIETPTMYLKTQY